MKELIKRAFEKHKSGRNCYSWKIRRELGMDRTAFDKALQELIVSRAVQVIGGDPSIMTPKQIEDSYKDRQGNLFPSVRWLEADPEAKAKRGRKKSKPKESPLATHKPETPEPVKPDPDATNYLVANMETIKAVCQKTVDPQKRWNAAPKLLPGLEAAMDFTTFKQQTPMLLAVIYAIDNKPKVMPPKKFMGWNVHEDKRGYVCLVRRIDGKTLKSIYVGKGWDEAKATMKIRSLKNPGPGPS